MQAVIIAGGEGTRLRPLTSTTPKPLLPIANRPMIGHVVDLLAKHQIRDIIVTVAYLGNAIRSYLGDGSEFGVSIRYLQEESPLGTAGAVANARDLIEGTFLVLSGDVLTDIDLTQAIAFHERQDATATLVLTSVESPIEFGIVATDERGSVSQLIEKPSWGEVFTDTVNTGIYVLEPEVLDRIPPGRAVDFSQEVFPSLLSDQQRLYGHVSKGYWADVGTFGGFFQTSRDILEGKVNLQLPGFSFQHGVLIGHDCEIDRSAVIEGPCLIGDHVHIGPDARIGPWSVIGDNTWIEAEATISGAICFEHVFVGQQAHLRAAIVGKGSELRTRTVIHDGAIIADGVYVGRDAVILPECKIYPAKKIDPMSTVTTSIVWEAGTSRSVFGPFGIAGLANIDVNPELATRIAMALGSLLPPHATAMAARDTSRSARMIKRALMIGFNAVGMDVDDLEVSTLPVLRHLVATTDAVAGVWVALDPDDPQALVITLLDPQGHDLSSSFRRKIERGLEREDFRRVSGSATGDLRAYPRSLESWKAELGRLLPLRRLRAARQKVVVDLSYGPGATTIPQALAALGVESLLVNSFPSTARTIELNPTDQLEELSRLVQGSSAALGILIDRSAEGVVIVDDQGQPVSDEELAVLMSELAFDTFGICGLVAPVSMPARLERIASEHQASFEWTGLSTADVAHTLSDKPALCLGVASRGRYHLSNSTSTPDAALTLGMLLAGLLDTGVPLSQLRADLRVPQVLTGEVPVPFSQMGATMRLLRDTLEASAQRLITIDGLRATDGDAFWLVAPDPQEPLVRLYSSHPDHDDARHQLEVLRTQVLASRDHMATP